jgi:hypothetical protein
MDRMKEYIIVFINFILGNLFNSKVLILLFLIAGIIFISNVTSIENFSTKIAFTVLGIVFISLALVLIFFFKK